MTPQQIQSVQRSFAMVQPIAPQAAAIFYAKLFERDPSLRALFRGDMRAQGEALMRMIGWAVARLDQAEALLPALREMGARHLNYGVETAHYETVGAALLDTLAAGLGEAFTPEVREAWATMYGVVAATMQEGAEAVLPA